MASYQVEFKVSAKKDLARLQPSIVTRIGDAIESLSTEPYPHGSRKLTGFEFRYRIRIGDYRVIYEVRNSILTIFVIRIGHRKDIYR